ncbi:MAG: hypothetical protein HN348_17210 [Proteobacteria bacterium]|jgi:hypothetical protein|nr:hypothetical protein [Pseudomonadota bacterium]
MEYHLEQIVARLIERLEGARRSYVGNPDKAMVEFRRIAEEHLQVLADDFAEHSDHIAFVRQEVLETFLPRYSRIAVEMTGREDHAFGFGVAAEPLGRAVAIIASLLALWVIVVRFLYVPAMWPVALAVISFPFWPDIAAFMYRSQYGRKLELILDDLKRIQDQSILEIPHGDD